MKHKWDKGKMVEDLKRAVEDARGMQPALIVVPTVREVKTFERNFKESVKDEQIFCCSFSEYYDGSWLMLKPRPKHIIAFRKDDIWKNLSADAVVEYGTSISYKELITKKEVEANEEA